MKKHPEIGLPEVAFSPTGRNSRPDDSMWAGLPHCHSDEDGNSYLVIPCQHMDVTIAYGEKADGLEYLVKQIQERISEIREMEGETFGKQASSSSAGSKP